MKIELIILLVSSTFLVSNSLAQNSDGPCGHWRPGDLDLGTWDMLDIFRLDRFESHLRTISQIEGSNAYQTAFRLEQSSNLTMRAEEAFPRGTPFEFSFECTYRERQKQQDSWHLFHLTNSHEESQLSVTLNPSRETLQVSLPDARGGLQHVEFRHSALFDQRWHKIMLGVTDREAKLWVDCNPVKGASGDMENQLRQRGQYNTENGQLSIAQLSNNRRRNNYSPPIDLQWMVLSCDPNRPAKQTCDEIPVYEVAHVEPEQIVGPPPCQICHGEPGLNGTDGRPGPRGERGFPGPAGPMGMPGQQGFRGERGDPGLQGLPGIATSIKGDKGNQGAAGLPGFDGQRGERGPSGVPGFEGMRGQKGERGDVGSPGLVGPPGPPGPQSLASPDEKGPAGVHYFLGASTGPRGERGESGPRGAPGSPGENGVPGRSVTDEEVAEICRLVLRENLEELTANLRGPVGLPGPIGPKGVQGMPGPQGSQGERGNRGFQGLNGMPGISGIQGERGAPGEKGDKGDKGNQGDTGRGETGATGPQGPPGTAGRDGVPGATGRIGVQGEQGAPGVSGARGPPGNPGQCPVECFQAMSQANALYYARAQGNQKGP